MITSKTRNVLHAGSRHIGKTIGETAISMARETAERQECKLRDRDRAWRPRSFAGDECA